MIATTAPKIGAVASRSSIPREAFTELPVLNMRVTVVRPSQKSWEITATETAMPNCQLNWKLNPMTMPSKKAWEQNSDAASRPKEGR